MRTEIIRELDADDARLEIPWASPTDPNQRYIDLKRFPAEIACLEEFRAFPPLGALLRKINAPVSPFRSVKCEAWIATTLAEDERLDFNLPFKVGSYVDLVFDRADWSAKLKPHLQLADTRSELLNDFLVQGQMEIVARRCLYHSEQRWGFSLTIFVHAYGSSLEEAQSELYRAVQALGDAISRAARSFKPVLESAAGVSSTP